MKKFRLLLEKQWFAYTFAACAAVLLYCIIEHFSGLSAFVKGFFSMISPIIIGLVFAYLLNPISAFFEKKLFCKMKKESARHAASVILTAVCVVLLLALLLVALVPSLIQSVTKLVNNMPEYTSKLEELVNKISSKADSFGIKIDISTISTFIDNTMAKGMQFVKNNTDKIMGMLGSVGSKISNFFIGILFGFCFLAAKKTLLSFASTLRMAVLRKEKYDKSNEMLNRCNTVFLRYVGYTLIDAMIVGVTTFVFLLVTRMPYAPLIAIMVAVTNIIPTFGPIIGGAIGIFFLVLDKPINALIFFAFICVIQALDGAVIKPRLFSGSLGIPGVWTLVLIILGGKVAGVLGILLAIPFAAIFVVFYQESIKPKLEKRKNAINAKAEATEVSENE